MSERRGAVWPAELLDTYVRIARYRPPDSLPATALRTRSTGARHPLAHAATGGQLSLEELIELARGGRQPGRRLRRWLHARPLSDLARVVALQDVLPEDLADGLALFDLALDVFGPDRVAPENQAVHAQLAFHVGDRARAAALLRAYRRMPEELRLELDIDLSNPYLVAGRPAAAWWRAFTRLLPKPAPALTDSTYSLPFDQLAAGAGARSRRGELISVVVTSFRPGPSLLTAVRSIVEQSWADTEILVVDDGSPPEFEAVLDECVALDDRVRLVKLPDNVGTYRARNAGIDAAAGQFVTFQDSDDWSHPGRLERQIRPLLDDPSIAATITDALRVSDQLVITRPDKLHRILNVSSLLVRKDTVVGRVGYFDGVRKAADSEYLARIEVAFGHEAVHRFRGELYALIRQSPDSLSRAEIRAGWMHPARIAYRSSYRLWHDRIRSGEATAYLPPTPARRPFRVPAHLTDDGGRATTRRYDALFVTDWRHFAGSQRSMYDEIRALVRRGLRVAVMHTEAYLLMSPYRRMLGTEIQTLINDGTVDEVFPWERVEVGVALVQPPHVLQFCVTTGSRIRAASTLIVANAAPAALDGRDRRYSTQACTEVATALFGADPLWCPRGPLVRRCLEAELDRSLIAPFDLPGVILPGEWATDRRRFRSDRPVLGRNSRDHWLRWPADRLALLGAYPDSQEIDVRIMGGAGAARALLQTPALPANWTVYQPNELPPRSFLFQLDFYSYFPHPDCAELSSRATLESLAAGAVVILPYVAAPMYQDAALYAGPAEVRKIVDIHHQAPDLCREQTARAGQWLRETHDGRAYASVVSDLR